MHFQEEDLIINCPPIWVLIFVGLHIHIPDESPVPA